MIHIKLVNSHKYQVLNDARLKYKSEPLFQNLFQSYEYKDVKMHQGWGKKDAYQTRPIPFDNSEVVFNFVNGIYCRVIQTNVPFLDLDFSTVNINYDYEENVITYFPTYHENYI